jgi:hypothetical protein
MAEDSWCVKGRELLISTLASPEKRIVYHLSDGRSSVEIVEESGVSAGSVNAYWKTWKNLGLMKIQKVKGGERSVRIFALDDFGIDIPKTPQKKRQEESASSSQNLLQTTDVIQTSSSTGGSSQ